MGTLEQMPKTDGVCDECRQKWRLRVWPDGKFRAVGNGGECTCGSLSFLRVRHTARK
jgi:hypothetical protein